MPHGRQTSVDGEVKSRVSPEGAPKVRRSISVNGVARQKHRLRQLTVTRVAPKQKYTKKAKRDPSMIEFVDACFAKNLPEARRKVPFFPFFFYRQAGVKRTTDTRSQGSAYDLGRGTVLMSPQNARHSISFSDSCVGFDVKIATTQERNMYYCGYPVYTP